MRLRNGSVSIADGPFVETKERVGGFFIIEARDLKEAILVASNTRRRTWTTAWEGHRDAAH